MSTMPQTLTATDLLKTREIVENLGLKWNGSRFDRYEAAVRAATHLEAGETDSSYFTENEGATERRATLMEGGGQLFQLMIAAEIFDGLDRPLLRKALAHVIDGPDVANSADDKPRSTLLELVTARVASTLGFKVNLTKDKEDVRLDHPEWGRGAIECKRPLHEDTLLSNLNEIGRQLWTRENAGSTYGFATIGGDRILGLAEGLVLGCNTIEEVEETTTQNVKGIISDVLATSRDPACSLVPTAKIGVVVVSGAVQIRKRRMIYPFCHAAHFPLVEPTEIPKGLDELLRNPPKNDSKYSTE